MDEITEVITQNIKKKRKEKRLTQGQLAEMVGVKDNTISTWESGRVPEAIYLYKICKALDVSISDLFGKYSNEQSEEGLSIELQDLLKKVNDLNEEGKEKLFDALTEEEQREVNLFIDFLISKR